MANVLIVVYLLIVLAMIAVILMQRSEGGALGIGGGQTGMKVRSAANLLTRTTAILGALFFATAIALTVVNDLDNTGSSILQNATQGSGEEAPTSVLDALNSLQGETPAETQPAEEAPAEPAPSGDVPDLAVPEPSSPPAQ